MTPLRGAELITDDELRRFEVDIRRHMAGIRFDVKGAIVNGLTCWSKRDCTAVVGNLTCQIISGIGEEGDRSGADYVQERVPEVTLGNKLVLDREMI